MLNLAGASQRFVELSNYTYMYVYTNIRPNCLNAQICNNISKLSSNNRIYENER